VVPPTEIEAAYEAMLQRLIADPIIAATKAILLPELPRIVGETDNAINANRGDALASRTDGYRDEIRRAVARLAAELERKITPGEVEPDIASVAQRANVHSADNVRRAFAASIRLSPYLGDKGVAEQLATWSRENVDLVTTMRTRYLDDVARMAVRAVGEGKRHEDVAREIQDRYLTVQGVNPAGGGAKVYRGVSYQARRIARDQVSKLNGDLDRMRYTAAGVTEYVWRTMRDARVRPEHEEREGRVFRFSDPPEGGHPGSEIQCRCYSEPVLSA
jgi:SPP1 gp7 family putative phage head morphogenesis protein